MFRMKQIAIVGILGLALVLATTIGIVGTQQSFAGNRGGTGQVGAGGNGVNPSGSTSGQNGEGQNDNSQGQGSGSTTPNGALQFNKGDHVRF